MQICLNIDKSTQESFKELGIELIEAIKEAENGINMEQIDFTNLIKEAESKVLK